MKISDKGKNKSKKNKKNHINQNMIDLYKMGIYAKTFHELKKENNTDKQSLYAMVLLFGM